MIAHFPVDGFGGIVLLVLFGFIIVNVVLRRPRR